MSQCSCSADANKITSREFQVDIHISFPFDTSSVLVFTSQLVSN